jgi:hypothetical protein
LDPVKVSVKAGPPAVAELKSSEASPGTGLPTVNIWPSDVPPPSGGLKIVTVAVRTVAKSAAGISAVSDELLT